MECYLHIYNFVERLVRNYRLFFHLAQKFTCISLNRNDRIRLIQADKAVIDAVEMTVREIWATRGGVQEVKDDRPLCYELKLKGYPWWSSGKRMGVFTCYECLFHKEYL